MNKWVRRLRHACRLKTSEKGEGYTNGGADENSHPGAEETNSDLDLERLESDENESSPTLSSSGPYIPISECFSGKPMIFNDAGEIDSRYYNTTNFPFPPEVNWATHPTKRETRTAPPTTNSKVVGPPAPPRPPKKQSGSASSTTSIPVTSATTKARKGSKSNESSKHPTPVPPPPTSSGSAPPRSVFRYDNFETEPQPDSSSTCSSLQSPPGSAGALYTNLSDLNTPEQGPIYQNPPKLRPGPPNSNNSQANPLPSPGDIANAESPAPQVNRSLKPDLLKKDGESSPTQRTGFQHSSGSMTLPSPRHSNFNSHRAHNPHRAAIPAIIVGPCIDRSQKPQESPLTLGPTPAQVKNQAHQGHTHIRSSSTSAAHFGIKSTPATSTLPSSPRRRAGPMVSPHEKNKHIVYHEYEQPPDELMGTYLTIDTKSIGKGDAGEVKIHSSKGSHHKKSPSFGPPSEESGSVEYRMIDHLMTKALNQTRQERNELLSSRVNPVPVSKIPN